MSGPGEAFDPYKHLNITINDDGTCTRHFNVPDVEPDPGPSPGMPTASKDVTVNHQTGVTARIFRPTNLPSNDNAVARLPIILHFHGSGWILFSSNSVSNHASCSQMASELTVILVSVSYRLAPEHRLPAPYDDALDALLWVKQQAIDPNGEPWLRDYADFSRCYVYGSSNGANIAFHVALRALDHVLTPLKIDGCVFYQPFLGGETRTKSELRNFADPVMPVPALDVIWELALPKGVDRDHRYCNPTAYLPHREKVGRLGRCLVIGYGGDAVVDRQQDFVKMLVTAGVKVEARFDDAGFHGIELVDPRRVVALLKSTSMATSALHRHDLPCVLVVKIPIAMDVLGDRFLASTKFQVLKAFESSLPLPDYLAVHSQSISAIVAPAHCPVTADLIRLLPSLRLVVTTSAGLDHVDLPECRRLGISVANAGTVFSDDVADTAVGLLIDILRRISASNRYVKRGLCPIEENYAQGSRLGGKRVGIIGLGSIGLEVAKRLEPFGCQISYSSRSQKQSVQYPFYADVVGLAANNDALIICCPLTEQTRRLINKDVFSALGKQGIVVNIARGGIVDEKEMVRCLLEGEIAGAGLDVFENEPNVPKELFELDNVVMSPHSAAITMEGLENLREIVVGNLEAFFSGEPLLTPVLEGQ